MKGLAPFVRDWQITKSTTDNEWIMDEARNEGMNAQCRPLGTRQVSNIEGFCSPTCRLVYTASVYEVGDIQARHDLEGERIVSRIAY